MRIIDVRYFPKDFSPSGNFPRIFSQVETSQVEKVMKVEQVEKINFSCLDYVRDEREKRSTAVKII